ncbi:MAG: sulfite exporter TauE/SafE family protein [Gemmatimonadales bacterium]|nr:sulfite exporter TauE/SafE family protein [Gemmatimonadales bacterium]
MNTLAPAVLGASLLGSVHCAAMCGAFTCLYADPDPQGGRGRAARRHHLAYNLGRLASYLLLGISAGVAGAWLGPAAALATGLLLVSWGIHALLRAKGVRLGAPQVPGFWQRAMGTVLLRFRDRAPAVRAATTGLATTLMPCGWMWAFVAVAAGTGSALSAAAVMSLFWVGTLPMMLTVGAAAQRLTGRFRTRLPLVSAVVIIVLGLASIALHLGVLPGGNALHRLLPAVPGFEAAHHHGP